MTAPAAPALPYVAGAVVELLRAQAGYLGLPAARIATRSPADVTAPHVLVQVPGNYALTVAGGVYRPLVQVEARAIEVPGDDPEAAVMAMAGRLAAVLAGAHNRTYSTTRWSTDRVIDGPMAGPTDQSRPTPLYRGLVRAELTVHAA